VIRVADTQAFRESEGLQKFIALLMAIEGRKGVDDRSGSMTLVRVGVHQPDR